MTTYAKISTKGRSGCYQEIWDVIERGTEGILMAKRTIEGDRPLKLFKMRDLQKGYVCLLQ